MKANQVRLMMKRKRMHNIGWSRFLLPALCLMLCSCDYHQKPASESEVRKMNESFVQTCTTIEMVLDTYSDNDNFEKDIKKQFDISIDYPEGYTAYRALRDLYSDMVKAKEPSGYILENGTIPRPVYGKNGDYWLDLSDGEEYFGLVLYDENLNLYAIFNDNFILAIRQNIDYVLDSSGE